MKKILFIALVCFFNLQFVAAQNSKTQMKPVPMEATRAPGPKVEKKETAKPASQNTTTTKATSNSKPASTSNAQQAKPVMKKDGTPDKRYKANQNLKKDGTPDKRFKKN